MTAIGSTREREQLADTMRWIYQRGWAPGTGGNFSVVTSQEPLRFLMSPSGVDKGAVQEADLIEVDQYGTVVAGTGSASAETLIHIAIAEQGDVGAILHTHSVWNTCVSLRYVQAGKVGIAGFEMLKGLSGVTTHEHEEILPILKNSQDMVLLSDQVRAQFRTTPAMHGLLLAGHGLYTWGRSLSEARRHLEVLEFLLEVVGNHH